MLGLELIPDAPSNDNLLWSPSSPGPTVSADPSSGDDLFKHGLDGSTDIIVSELRVCMSHCPNMVTARGTSGGPSGSSKGGLIALSGNWVPAQIVHDFSQVMQNCKNIANESKSYFQLLVWSTTIIR